MRNLLSQILPVFRSHFPLTTISRGEYIGGAPQTICVDAVFIRCRTGVELDLIRRVQAKEETEGKVRTQVATAYGPGQILDIRSRDVDGTTVTDLHVKLPYGDAFLALDALSGNPIRFKPDDKVTTPFGPARVKTMRITEHSKLYEVSLINWTLSGGDFAKATLSVSDPLCSWPVRS